MRAYLSDIREILFLSKEEERELSERIQKAIKKGEERDIEAEQMLVRANLRLVIKPAIVCYNAFRGFFGSLSVMDLISEGNIGLMRAAQTFDYKKGKFSTYAFFWISQKINRAAAKSSIVQMPLRSKRRIKPIFLDNLSGNNNGENNNIYYQLLKFSEEKESSFDEMIFSQDAEKIIDKVLKTLSEIEEHVIRRRFGIGAKEETLREIGQRLRLSRERVRQIEEETLKKLHHPSRAKKLKPLLDDD